MGSGRKSKVSLELCNFGGFDCIIVELLEGLLVLGVSSPPIAVPFE